MNDSQSPDATDVDARVHRADRICDQFEAAWKAGQRLRIEDHLAAVPDAERPALLYELLQLEIDYRRLAGDELKADEFLDRFPALDRRWLNEQLPGTVPGLTDLITVTASPPSVLPVDSLIGRRVGPYLIQQRLGQGGMGSVYRALRQDDYEQQVAVKVIRQGLETEALLRRFRTERQVLAGLPHPNIARLLDGGTMEDGRPYFVMEYIEGEPLDRYCNRLELTTRERLHLLEAVCQAVQHAHERQVVHRDLKPANVLVMGDGTPKVTDFGLAKRLESADDRAAATQSGAILGTPSYMAPEQAAGRSEEVGAAVDVYALGAILYELLTGRPPFRADSPLETLLQVRSEDPVPPSRLHPRLPRDLETLCLKCLEKRPCDRYPSAGMVALELRRFLNGEPIQARPASRPERAWRWCRRNPWLAGLTAALVLVLFGSLAGLTGLWLRAEQQRHAAAEQRDLAQTNLDLARKAVDEALTKLADDVRLKQADFHELRKELLQTALPFYEQFVRQQREDPDLEAERGRVYGRLALVRAELGDTDGALAAYGEERLVFQALTAADPSQSAYALDLARCHDNLGRLLHTFGRHQEARTASQAGLNILVPLVDQHPTEPEFSQELGRCHYHLGNLLRETSAIAEAKKEFEAARAVQERLVAEFRHVPDYRAELAASQNGLGTLLNDTGNWADAEKAYRAALEIQKSLVADFPRAPVHRSNLATAYGNLGNVLRDNNRRTEAAVAYRSALSIQDRLVADFPSVPDYRQSLGRFHNNLGLLLRRSGQPVQSEAAHRAAIEVFERLVHDFSRTPAYREDLAGSHYNLGNLFYATGKHEAAERDYVAALKVWGELTADHPGVPMYAVGLAACHTKVGDVARDRQKLVAALDAYGKAIATLENLLTRVPKLAAARDVLDSAYRGRAKALVALARPNEALKDWDRLVDLASSADRPSVRLERAGVLVQAGQPAAAVAEADALTADAKLPADALYDAACVYALASAVAKDSRIQSETLASRSFALLRRAIAAGYKDVANMKADSDLTSLRSREEFKALLREMEARQR
jgi:tetratricopeptide (TPR) repeat protein